MAQRTHSEKTPRASQERSGPAPSERIAGTGKRLSETLDRLVDDIDDVLEENAEVFLKGYVQRGGE
jgi:ubiquitin-like protein Pup